MNRETLEPLFRSLPREKASELFTERVMARVRATSKPPARPRRAYALALASLLLVAIGLAGAAGWHRAEKADTSRLQAARTEQLRLERELQEIKEMTDGLQPVVYLGSTPEYDYYIDLRTLQEGSAVAQPASYRPGSRPGI